MKRFVNHAFSMARASIGRGYAIAVKDAIDADHENIIVRYGFDHYDTESVARLVHAAPEMFALLARTAVCLALHADADSKMAREIIGDACVIMDRVAGDGFCDAMEGDTTVAAVRK